MRVRDEGYRVFLSEEIHRYEGAIAQFLGDGVMALFGAPIAHEDAPQRALYAALGIQQRLRGYADNLRKDGIEFSMRIGLNTGLVGFGRVFDLPARFGFEALTFDTTSVFDSVQVGEERFTKTEPNANVLRVTDASRCSVLATTPRAEGLSPCRTWCAAAISGTGLRRRTQPTRSASGR
jgi:hypothetical protein